LGNNTAMKDLNEMFRVRGASKPLKRGRVLISEPFLQDGVFHRSLVLLTEYSAEGAIGFVLNKPLDVAIHQLVDGFPHCDAAVCLGGPVSPERLHYLHRIPGVEDAIEVKKGLWWGGQLKCIREGIESGSIHSDQIRFFLGYSGWSPGQLEEELGRNAWVVGDMNAAVVLSVSPGGWNEMVRSLGDAFRSWHIVPENPHWN